MKKWIINLAGMMLVLTLGIILFIYCDTAAASTEFEQEVLDWQFVGNPGFSSGEVSNSVSLFIDQGTPYVSFADWNHNGKATVMKFKEGLWQPVGTPGFSTGMVNSGRAKLYVYSGVPYVAFADMDNNSRAKVMRYIDGFWQNVGNPDFFFRNNIPDFSLYVYKDIPYIAYSDPLNGNKATVMKYSDGLWQPVGLPGFSNGGTFFTSLIIDQGVPYVAFKDYGNEEKITVMKYTDGSWQAVGQSGFSSDFASYVSLYVDQGKPYVAFQDARNEQKLRVMKYTDGFWQTVGDPGISSGCVFDTSIIVYQGTPYVAFTELDFKSTVMKYTDGLWQVVGRTLYDSIGDPTSFCIFQGTLYVAFQDYPKGRKATVMKYVDQLSDDNTNDLIKILINNVEQHFPQPHVMINGRVMVPMRGIFEALGAEVEWNNETKTVTATKGDTVIVLTIGDSTAYKNGQPVALDPPAQIVYGSTMVPVRFVSEAMGADVKWDGVNKIVNINTNNNNTNYNTFLKYDDPAFDINSDVISITGNTSQLIEAFDKKYNVDISLQTKIDMLEADVTDFTNGMNKSIIRLEGEINDFKGNDEMVSYLTKMKGLAERDLQSKFLVLKGKIAEFKAVGFSLKGAGGVGDIIDTAQLADSVNNLIDDYKNDRVSFQDSWTPVVEGVISYHPLYGSCISIKNDIFSMIEINTEIKNLAVSEAGTLISSYVVQYDYISDIGYKTGLEDKSKIQANEVLQQNLVLLASYRDEFRKSFDDMLDNSWKYGIIGDGVTLRDNLFFYRNNILGEDNEQSIKERQSEVFWEGYEKGKKYQYTKQLIQELGIY